MNEENYSNVIVFRPRRDTGIPSGFCKKNRITLKMLYSLAEYASRKLEIGQDVIQAMVVTSFGVRGFDQLQKDDYKRASQYIFALIDDHAVKQ